MFKPEYEEYLLPTRNSLTCTTADISTPRHDPLPRQREEDRVDCCPRLGINGGPAGRVWYVGCLCHRRYPVKSHLVAEAFAPTVISREYAPALPFTAPAVPFQIQEPAEIVPPAGSAICQTFWQWRGPDEGRFKSESPASVMINLVIADSAVSVEANH